MEAQGTLVPSLTMEMLRVVTHAGAILIRTDQAGVQSVAVPGLEVADRPQRPVLGPFQQARSGALRVGHGRAARPRRRPTAFAAGWC